MGKRWFLGLSSESWVSDFSDKPKLKKQTLNKDWLLFTIYIHILLQHIEFWNILKVTASREMDQHDIYIYICIYIYIIINPYTWNPIFDSENKSLVLSTPLNTMKVSWDDYSLSLSIYIYVYVYIYIWKKWCSKPPTSTWSCSQLQWFLLHFSLYHHGLPCFASHSTNAIDPSDFPRSPSVSSVLWGESRNGDLAWFMVRKIIYKLEADGNCPLPWLITGGYLT